MEIVQRARVKFSHLNDHFCVFMPLNFFISSVKKWQAKLHCSIIIQLTLAREVVFITRLIYVNNVLVVVKDCRACRLLTPFSSLEERWAMMICSNTTFISKIYHLYNHRLLSCLLFPFKHVILIISMVHVCKFVCKCDISFYITYKYFEWNVD